MVNIIISCNLGLTENQLRPTGLHNTHYTRCTHTIPGAHTLYQVHIHHACVHVPGILQGVTPHCSDSFDESNIRRLTGSCGQTLLSSHDLRFKVTLTSEWYLVICLQIQLIITYMRRTALFYNI